MPCHFTHYLFQEFPDKNMSKCQNVVRYRTLYLHICREMRWKCKFQMALNSCKIDNVEKMFWGDREVHVL